MRTKVATELRQRYIAEENTNLGKQIKVDWATDFGENIEMTKLKHLITLTTVIGNRSL